MALNRKPKAAKPADCSVVSHPAPIGGVNARDGLANMPETDAVELVNWIPDSGGVRCRKGFREWATNLPSEVQSVMAYFSPATTYPAGTFLTSPTTMPGKLFAATKEGIYDITTSTDAPAASKLLAGSAYSGWFSSTMLTNTAGSFLLACSEDDGYLTYDGSTWLSVTMGAGATQIAGVDPSTFVHVLNWKRRAWFVQKNSTKAWYLPVDQLYGTAVAFDFGPLFKNGGHLSYLANWSIDAGEGIDDFLVAVSSNGDVAVYKGTDPSSGSTFGLVGMWTVGQIPVGRRAYAQYGGDLVLTSADGVFPISFVTRGGAQLLVASSSEYSSYIRAKLGPQIRKSFTYRGWDMFLHPSERLLLINIPDETQKGSQWAMNTTLNRWCRLQDIPVTCFGATGGYSFSGTADGRVLLLFSSFYDNVPYGESEGDPIYGIVQPAFSSFGTPAMSKLLTMLQLHFVGAAEPGVAVSVATDYGGVSFYTYPRVSVDGSSLWGTGRFDSAIWSAEGGRAFSGWIGVGAEGAALSPVVQTACVGDVILSSIDYQFRVLNQFGQRSQG